MRNRTLARQQARADNKARLKQAQLERHRMATQPAANAPQIEERNFTAAEFELFSVKYAEYQKMANAVNELLAFLKKQHGIKDGEGWQLGERGFVRAARAEDAPVTTKPKRSRPARASKKAADLPALGQGENVATVAQNGQLAAEAMV